MLDSKYNRFLWYCLTDNLDDITNYEGKLHCEVPFEDYKINEVPDDNFYSKLDKFIANNNLKISNYGRFIICYGNTISCVKRSTIYGRDCLLRSQDSKRAVLTCAFRIAEPHYGYVDSKHVTRMSNSFHSRSKLIL